MHLKTLILFVLMLLCICGPVAGAAIDHGAETAGTPDGAENAADQKAVKQTGRPSKNITDLVLDAAEPAQVGLSALQGNEKKAAGQTPTTEPTASPADEPGNVTPVSDADPELSLISTYVLLLGASALGLGMLFFRTAGESEKYMAVQDRRAAWLIALGHGAIAVILATASLILLPAIYSALGSEWSGSLLIAGALDLLLVYLALSSAILAASAARYRPAILIHRVHPPVAFAAALIFWAVFEAYPGVAREIMGEEGLYAALIFSALIALWHYRGFRAEPDSPEPDAGKDGKTDTIPDEARTLLTEAPQPSRACPPGFPHDLLERYGGPVYVGKGGLGQVFRVSRRDDGEIVAVKIPLSFDEVTGKSFMKEMRFWEDLRHPNIVEVYSVNILPIPYVEMEYVPGSLERLKKPVDPGVAAHIVGAVASGLAYAHDKGVIHRDVKPHNILLTDEMTPKITDWGMGTFLADNQETSVAGFSLAYAAPEQIAPKQFGRTGAWTDIYQLGVVFYELLTGEVPNPNETIAEYGTALLNGEPIPPSQIRQDLAAFDTIIARCLAKDPAGRYRSAGELQEAIENLIYTCDGTGENGIGMES